MNSRKAKSAAPLSRENQIELANLCNEELLTQFANSPCATRNIPTGQSLEEYLLRVQPGVPVDSLEPSRTGAAKQKAMRKQESQ